MGTHRLILNNNLLTNNQHSFVNYNLSTNNRLLVLKLGCNNKLTDYKALKP